MFQFGLTAYTWIQYTNRHPDELNQERVVFDPLPKDVDEAIYEISEVEKFIEENPDMINTPLSVSEKRELGRLRKKSEKIDKMLKVSVSIGLAIQANEFEYKLTKPALKEFVRKCGFPELEGRTTIDDIWKVIPEDYKNMTGGDSKKPMKNIKV